MIELVTLEQISIESGLAACNGTADDYSVISIMKYQKVDISARSDLFITGNKDGLGNNAKVLMVCKPVI